MKPGIITPLRTVALIVLGFGVALTVRGQIPTATPGRGGRPDKIQRELERRVEMQMIEQAMVVGGSPHVKRYPPLVLDQIRADFLRIQVIDRRLIKATADSDTLDLAFVSRSVSEIRKRSRRLKENLALPPPETPLAGRWEIEIEATNERLRISISDLSKLIDEFVSNPMFEESKLVDARLSSKARQDIEAIIELSSQIKRSSEKLKAAAKVP